MTADTSISDGAPIEFYKFVSDFGTFRYTSSPNAQVLLGEAYEPVHIVRNAVETGSVIDAIQTMDFIIPADNPLALLYCYEVNPLTLTVEVRRAHYGEDFDSTYTVEYVGEGTGGSVNGLLATIETGDALQSRLAGNMSAVYYQRTCNHALYDERCQVDPAGFTTTSTVTKIQAQIITVVNDGFPNDALIGGTLVNNRTGERRTIISNTDNVIRVGYKFVDIELDDEVDIIRGCDHARLGDCKLVFNNTARYGGFDFIPVDNPFAEISKTLADIVTTINTEKRKRITIPATAGG